MPYRVLVADDSQIFRNSVRVLFEEAGWQVVSEAVNGIEAIQKTKALSPDLIVLNVSMPLLNGIEALPEILAHAPQPKVVVFTLHDSETFRQEMSQLGAHGCVAKSQPLADLLIEANRILPTKR